MGNIIDFFFLISHEAFFKLGLEKKLHLYLIVCKYLSGLSVTTSFIKKISILFKIDILGFFFIFCISIFMTHYNNNTIDCRPD